MEKITRRIKLAFSDSFASAVTIGQKVETGMLLGKVKVRKVLERISIPEKGAKVLIDQGVFVDVGTPVLSIKKGFSSEEIVTKNSGVVIIRGKEIIIGGGQTVKKVVSPVNGRVMLVAPQECSIDADFYRLPVVVSQGKVVEGKLSVISRKALETKDKAENLKNKIVFFNDMLTKEAVERFVKLNVKGIITPYIGWKNYMDVFSEHAIPIAILLGFGQGQLSKFLIDLFTSIDGTYLIADFSESMLYLSTDDIMKNSSGKYLLFRDDLWGKEIESLEEYDINQELVTLKSKEKIIVDKSEVTKIL